MDGGFFLIAHGDTEQGGQRTKHTEIIGYDHEAGAAPADVLASRLYTNRGDTLSYTHEVDEQGMTSWFGAKGSPAVFRALERRKDAERRVGMAGRRLQADHDAGRGRWSSLADLACA